MNISKTKKDIPKRKTPFFFTLKGLSNKQQLFFYFMDTLKLILRVFLASYSVAMVTYCVPKMIPSCSPVMGHYFDTKIVASIDNEW